MLRAAFSGAEGGASAGGGRASAPPAKAPTSPARATAAAGSDDSSAPVFGTPIRVAQPPLSAHATPLRAPAATASASLARPAPGLGLNILADPYPGRVYVLVAVARGLPVDAFGGFGKPTLRSRLRAFGQERLGRPVDCYERAGGPSKGLGCLLHAQVYAFKATAPLHSARLRLDLLAHRLVRGAFGQRGKGWWHVCHVATGSASAMALAVS